MYLRAGSKEQMLGAPRKKSKFINIVVDLKPTLNLVWEKIRRKKIDFYIKYH